MARGIMTRMEYGRRYRVILPYSEVCMFMREADKARDIALYATPYDSAVAKVYDDYGRELCAPITYSEAGAYKDSEGYYCYTLAGYDSVPESSYTGRYFARNSIVSTMLPITWTAYLVTHTRVDDMHNGIALLCDDTRHVYYINSPEGVAPQYDHYMARVLYNRAAYGVDSFYVPQEAR